MMENYYLKLYLRFLKQEIPSIIQIITFSGFVVVLFRQNWLAIILTSTFMPVILMLYLLEKIVLFLEKLILRSAFSNKNVDETMILGRWERYIKWTAIISGALFGVISWFV